MSDKTNTLDPITEHFLKSNPKVEALLVLAARAEDSKEVRLSKALARHCVERVGVEKSVSLIAHALRENSKVIETAMHAFAPGEGNEDVSQPRGDSKYSGFSEYDDEMRRLKRENPRIFQKTLASQLADWWWQSHKPESFAQGNVAPDYVFHAAKRHIQRLFGA